MTTDRQAARLWLLEIDRGDSVELVTFRDEDDATDYANDLLMAMCSSEARETGFAISRLEVAA